VNWDDFARATVQTDGAAISVSHGGTGPAVLLLHGFPQTKLMWREIAIRLAEQFFVVAADLRGYGDSSTPPSTSDQMPYSKRAMANDMIQVMAHLGHDRFVVAGHDRGGRVAYRMALDHPQAVSRLAVLDVLPVDIVWDRAEERMALAFWPWSLLAQAEPLPERLLTGAPDAVIAHALSSEWGTPAETFAEEDRTAYTAMLGDGEHAHAICEEYRAAAGVDRDHDAEDRRKRRRITCPMLALWSARGPLSSWYSDLGGPLAIWRDLADDVAGGPVEGGHFFPEEHPDQTATALAGFFNGVESIH
jgi:haloacetate dehalogenase